MATLAAITDSSRYAATISGTSGGSEAGGVTGAARRRLRASTARKTPYSPWVQASRTAEVQSRARATAAHADTREDSNPACRGHAASPDGPAACATLGRVPAIDRPILRDGDLTLRPPRPEDADAVTAACQDPEIARWTLVPSPYRREHAEQWLADSPVRARAGETASYLGFDAEGRLVGSISLMELDLDRGYGEVGYWIAAPARRRGFATRAVVLMREFGRTTLGLSTIELLAHRDNAPSRRVAERAGFTDTGELRHLPRGPREPGAPANMVYAWHVEDDREA